MRNSSWLYLWPVPEVDAPYHCNFARSMATAVASGSPGPDLPLFHGVGADSATWEPVHAKLAQRFTVIAPDLLGHAQLRSDWACAAGPPCARYIRSVSSYIPYVSIEGTGLE